MSPSEIGLIVGLDYPSNNIDDDNIMYNSTINDIRPIIENPIFSVFRDIGLK